MHGVARVEDARRREAGEGEEDELARQADHDARRAVEPALELREVDLGRLANGYRAWEIEEGKMMRSARSGRGVALYVRDDDATGRLTDSGAVEGGERTRAREGSGRAGAARSGRAPGRI